MAKTPNTSAATYLPASEFLKRVDTRKVAQLVSDTSAAVAAAALASDANLAAALLDASGLLEAAVLTGKKYDPVDLAALTGAGQAFLYRLLTPLAWNFLIDRRLDLNLPLHKQTEWAEGQLEKLAQGERIFSFSESQDAGHLDYSNQTAADEAARNGIVSQAGRIFGRRSNQNW